MRGAGGGKKVIIEPHRHEGVFIARSKEDVLVTRNLVPGESVYGEKRMTVEDTPVTLNTLSTTQFYIRYITFKFTIQF